MHGEWLIADRRSRAQHCVPQTQRLALSDVDAGCVRRDDVANGLQHLLVARRFEGALQLGVAVEVILDRALRTAGYEHELPDARFKRFLHRVLNERLVDCLLDTSPSPRDS